MGSDTLVALFTSIPAIIFGIFILIWLALWIVVPFMIYSIMNKTAKLNTRLAELIKIESTRGARVATPCVSCHKAFDAGDMQVFKGLQFCPDCFAEFKKDPRANLKKLGWSTV